MAVIPIADPRDPRLAEYVSLRDVQLRTRVETERGIFIAEGEKVIRRAAESGYEARSFLLAQRWLAGLAEVLADWPDAPVYLVSEELAEQVTGFHVHRGALAAFARREPAEPAELLRMRRLLVAEDIVDHTNVGALLRSAAALGWDGCLLAPRCADPLYRRAIKVSMGAVFSLPWSRLPDHWHAVETLRGAGFLVAALALTPTAIPLEEFAGRVQEGDARVALLCGTEGSGLSERWLAEADVHVVIPMSRGIDSLNVAAAAAVACYALR